MSEQTKIALESGHWYDAKTGESRYEITGKNGKLRATTIRDAREHGYVPSVTTILRVLARPGLENWLQDQVLESAATMPMLPGQTEIEWRKLVKAESKLKSQQAAARGTAIHTAIERHAQGKTVEPEYFKHVNAVEIEMERISLPLGYGKTEHSFAHADGFGGKTDWSSDVAIVDFKTKEKIEDDKTLQYDEHVAQLAAYAYGLGIVAPRCVNIFVGVNDCKVVSVEANPVEIEQGLEMFKLALRIWQLKNDFDPRKINEPIESKLERMGL